MRKKRKQPDNLSPASKKHALAVPASAAPTSSTALTPLVNTATAADGKQEKRRELLQKKVLRLTKKLEKASTPAKKALLQAKLLKRLASLADQENQGAPPTPTPPAPAPARPAPPTQAARPAAPIISRPATAADIAKRSARAQRFAADQPTAPDEEEVQLVEAREAGRLWGTSTQLEKEYLRLTTLPPASAIRPPDVLRKALKLVKTKWVQQGDYRQAWQQLKAIRQDLTVQHVEGPLAVDAYETHARIALEVADWPEFQQCQAVLQRLYPRVQHAGCPEEFAAYAVLHAASHGGAILQRELARLAPEQLAAPLVRHAVAVIRAYRAQDWWSLLALYATAPRMTPYLMDALLARLRPAALRALAAAFHPQPLPLAYVAAHLGLPDAQQAAAFCEAQDAVVDRAAQALDTKASRARTAAAPQLP